MKKTLSALIACAALALCSAAHAGAVNFDDLTTDGDFASLNDASPYAGLTWSADWYAGDNTIDGYANGAHSGKNFAVNGFGSDAAEISSGTAFNFAGAWFATPEGGADKASWINITAYDVANNIIGSTGNVNISDSFMWVAGGFANVSRLSIARDTGWYVMDDLVTGGASVPEPGTPLMLGAGLLMLGLGRRLSRR